MAFSFRKPRPVPPRPPPESVDDEGGPPLPDAAPITVPREQLHLNHSGQRACDNHAERLFVSLVYRRAVFDSEPGWRYLCAECAAGYRLRRR